MLDLAWSELMVIGVVALVVIGPKDLPVVLRTAGRWMGKARGLAREFQSNVDDMIRESELHELRNQMSSLANINPLQALERSLDVTPHPAPETRTVPNDAEPAAEPVMQAAESNHGASADALPPVPDAPPVPVPAPTPPKA